MNLKDKVIHYGFEIGIKLKGLNGVLETIGGLALLFMSTGSVYRVVVFLTQGELAEDPKDFISNYLLGIAHSLSLSTKIFVAIYLLSHGIIKIALVAWLEEHKLWAYPAAIVIFILFLAYQLFKYINTASPGLMLLSILDAVVIILTWLEYRIVRQKAPQA